jgi:hypothetical protein
MFECSPFVAVAVMIWLQAKAERHDVRIDILYEHVVLNARKTPPTTRKSVRVQRPVVNDQTSTPHLLGEFCCQ